MSEAQWTARVQRKVLEARRVARAAKVVLAPEGVQPLGTTKTEKTGYWLPDGLEREPHPAKRYRMGFGVTMH
jgi:hypothetical protein